MILLSPKPNGQGSYTMYRISANNCRDNYFFEFVDILLELLERRCQCATRVKIRPYYEQSATSALSSLDIHEHPRCLFKLDIPHGVKFQNNMSDAGLKRPDKINHETT